MTNMDLLQASTQLDETLPEELRVTADLLSQNENPVTPSEATMTTANTPLTNDAVTLAARQEVTRIMAEKDNQVAIATILEKHMLTAHQATANLADAQTKLTASETKLAQVEAELAEAKKKFPTAEPTDSKTADKDAKDNKGKQPPAGKADASVTSTPPADQAVAALQAQVAELTVALAAEKKKAGKADWFDKAKARKEKLAKAGIKSKKFMDKAEASDESGTPVMSDAEFDSTLEMLAEQSPETPAATAASTGGTPVAAPVDGAGPASKQSTPSLTGKGKEGGAPVAAPKDDAGPASKQPHAKMAHASEEAPAAGEQAVASATPAAPDLSGAEIMQQATAALMQGGPVPTAQGKNAYAKAFGI